MRTPLRVAVILGQELLRTVLLVAATLLVLGMLVQWVFPAISYETLHRVGPGPAGATPESIAASQPPGFWRGLGDFVLGAGRDQNGRPLLDAFCDAVWPTLGLLSAAIGLLLILSTLLGTLLAVSPRWQWLKLILLGVSAVPSFMWPFLYYLVAAWLPGAKIEFRGFHSGMSVIWPALALALGDLNLFSIANVYTESLRYELGRPHARISQALRGTAWLDVWPRSAVVMIGAVAARIPHLFGGMIAMEILFEIQGLGMMACKAIANVPPDYHQLVWVCAFGILVGRVFGVLHRIGVLFLMPDAGEEFTSVELAEPDGPKSGREGPATIGPGLGQTASSGASPILRIPEFVAIASPAPGRIPLATWAAKIRYYLRVQPANWIKLVLASAIWIAFAAVLVAIGAIYPLVGDHSVPRGGFQSEFLSACRAHWLGTDGVGSDVLTNLGRGLAQQAPALLTALLVCLAAALLAAVGLSGSHAGRGFRPWLRRGIAACLNSLAEFVESIPKIIILLAALTFFDNSQIVFKLYIVIGIIFAPQLYRAVNEDLLVLRKSMFLEAAATAGIPWRRILWQNVFKNHCLHVVTVHSALLAGAIVHVDALLGFLGTSNRGEVFTWGSVLGVGAQEFMGLRPGALAGGLPFNDGVVWGPLLAIWLGILACITLADALKIPLGGYVYRIR
jgi:peptide/nickel transport system permease protein